MKGGLRWSPGADKARTTTPEQKARFAQVIHTSQQRAGMVDALYALRDRLGHRQVWYGGTVPEATRLKRRARNKRARQARALHRRKS